MRAVSVERATRATEIVRTDDRETEQLFGSCLADIARTLWPENTAPSIAAAAGCSTRAAEFYLAGDREWSGDAITAIVSEILLRHKMRNVKVTKR
jgi:hypothetical protein